MKIGFTTSVIQRGKTGVAQDVERFENHFARVDAAEPVEQFFVERLHAHRNTVHAE